MKRQLPTAPQEELEKWLEAVLGSDADIREEAERWIEEHEGRPNFLYALVTYACTGGVPGSLFSEVLLPAPLPPSPPSSPGRTCRPGSRPGSPQRLRSRGDADIENGGSGGIAGFSSPRRRARRRHSQQRSEGEGGGASRTRDTSPAFPCTPPSPQGAPIQEARLPSEPPAAVVEAAEVISSSTSGSDAEDGATAPAFAEELDRGEDLKWRLLRSAEQAAATARRVLAAIVAKQLIKKHPRVGVGSVAATTTTGLGCSDGADTSVEWRVASPLISKDELNSVKAMLLQHLIYLPPPVRHIIHLIVAMIAFREGLPSGWPRLFPTLRYLLHQCRERCLTEGTTALLELLSVMAAPDDPRESLASAILNESFGLQDGLLHLAEGMRQFNITKQRNEATVRSQYRRRCLEIYTACVRRIAQEGRTHELTTVSGGSSGLLASLVLPHLPEWRTVVTDLVEEAAAAPTDLEATKSALICLRYLEALCGTRTLERETVDCFNLTLRKCSKVLSVYLPYYTSMVINDIDGAASIEEDGEGGPTTFVVQLCKTIEECAPRRSLEILHTEGVHQMLLKDLIPYFRVTEHEQDRCLTSASEYLMGEEEEGSSLELLARQAGKQMILALLHDARRATRATLMGAISLLLESTAAAEVEDDPNVWKSIELALWLVGILGEHDPALFEEPWSRRNASQLELIVIRIGRCVGDTSGHTTPLLRARSLMCATRLSAFLLRQYPDDIDKLLLISAQGVDPNTPLPVRVAAFKALERFVPLCPTDKLVAILQRGVLANLVFFIQESDEDFLRLTLRVLVCIVKAVPEAVLDAADGLIPLIMKSWAKYCNDPLVTIEFQDFLEAAVKSHERLRECIESHLLPLILKALHSAAQQPESADVHQLGMSLELLLILLHTAEGNIVPERLWRGCDLVMLILLLADEATVIQTACETFAHYLKRGQQQISAEPEKLRDVLQVAQRLLSPALQDRAALMVGSLLQVFLRTFGSELPADLLSQIFSAMLKRIITAELPALQQSLMIVLCRYICFSPEEMFNVLDTITVPIDGQQIPGFIVWVTCWLERLDRPERFVAGAYSRKVTLIALLSVLKYRFDQLCLLGDGQFALVSQILTFLVTRLKHLRDRQRRRDLRKGRLTSRGQSTISSSSSNRGGAGVGRRAKGSVLSEMSGLDETSGSEAEDYFSVSSSDEEDGSYSDVEVDHRPTDDACCDGNVFAEDEARDPIMQADLEAILYSELHQMWESPSKPLQAAFRSLSFETLEAWSYCCAHAPALAPSDSSRPPLTASPGPWGLQEPKLPAPAPAVEVEVPLDGSASRRKHHHHHHHEGRELEEGAERGRTGDDDDASTRDLAPVAPSVTQEHSSGSTTIENDTLASLALL